MKNRKQQTRQRKREFEQFDAEQVVEGGEDSRTIYLVGDIDEEMIRSTTEKLIALSERDAKSPITMIINTYGGDVYDTFMLYDLMKYVSTPIHTVGLGKIMSAGCLLLAAGKKGERKMGKNAQMMYLCGWDHIHGNIFEMRASLQAFEQQEDKYDSCFAAETGLTLENVRKLYDRDGPTRDRYISAEEAKKLGAIDSII